jgi:hypothetical protein
LNQNTRATAPTMAAGIRIVRGRSPTPFGLSGERRVLCDAACNGRGASWLRPERQASCFWKHDSEQNQFWPTRHPERVYTSSPQKAHCGEPITSCPL